MSRRLGLILLASLGCLAVAQDTKDPIDKKLDACLRSPSGASTVGQEDCAATAYKAWDAELNKNYQSLLKTLNPAVRESLKASQRQWLSFFEAEKKFQPLWARDQGTLGAVSVALANVDIVKARALTLRNYSGDQNPK